MNDIAKPAADLSDVPTCVLHAEIIKREGVTATFLGPEDQISKIVRGPAWVIVNRD